MVDDFNVMETMLQKGWYHKNLQLGGLNEPFVQSCTYIWALKMATFMESGFLDS